MRELVFQQLHILGSEASLLISSCNLTNFLLVQKLFATVTKQMHKLSSFTEFHAALFKLHCLRVT
jgi:hypothetical protein